MKPLFLHIFLFCLFSLQAFSQSATKLPPNSGILYFGDSQTSYGFSQNGNSVQYQNYGYLAWVNALCPDVYTPKGGMLGVPGETTTQMVSRLDAIKTFNAKFIVVLAGTNDPLYGISPATTEANLRKIYDAGIAAGLKVIVVTIMPRFAPNAYSTTNESNRKLINAWIKAQTDVIVVDVENDVNDPKYFDDGLHNSPLGAYVVGNRVATEVNNRVAHCLAGSLSAADLSVASNSNPFFAGTGGSFNTASGTVATSWQLAGNQAGGATVVGSKETDASGTVKQVMTISGNYTGSYVLAAVNNYAASPISLAAGNVVEGVAEVEIPAAMTGVKAVYLQVTAYTGDYSSTIASGNSMFPTSSGSLYMPAGKYLLRTPAITINSAVGQLSTQIVVQFESTTTAKPVSAVIKASSAGIRRLPLAAGPLASITPSGSVPVCPGSPVQLTAGTGNGYTFQWQLNGSNLSGATAASLSAANPGSYTVKVTTTGCAVLSDPTVLVTGTCQTAAISTGSIAAKLCMGQTVGVPFTKTGTFNTGNVFTAQLSDGKGSFASPVNIGTLTGTASGTITAVIPSNLPQDIGYRIRVVSSNPAVTGSNNGANISIYAIPTLTSTATPPAVCNNAVFTYTPTSSVSGTTFNWSRAAVSGISNATAAGAGSISEALTNTTAAPVSVTYVYTLSNNGCSGTKAYNVAVTVNPSPVAKTKNITVALDATGKVSLTPQQVDNGSTGYCGTLQYSLDKTQFSCSNIGANAVTLRVTDGAGNSSTAPATVTVVDNSGPVIANASASPSVLWPATQSMVNVTINYSATDNCSAVTTSLSVKSNEAQSNVFKHDKKGDWVIKTNHLVQLRAERNPSGSGRIYTITITAKDARGNTSTKDVTVSVPVLAPLLFTTASKGETFGTEEAITGLQVTVLPNPSPAFFTLQTRSNSEAPLTIRTFDAAGRVMETKTKVAANGVLQLGQNYRPGLYLVEVVQDTQVVIQRLIKL